LHPNGGRIVYLNFSRSLTGARMLRGIIALILGACVLLAESPAWDQAHELYQKTNYQKAIEVLSNIKDRDAGVLQLLGQSYFMLADYKKAGDTFERALALDPRNSALHHWMGRAWGRRAETGSVLTAPGYASKARQKFEKAVQLDPNNHEAVNDLFDYYLQAPGFLGGGIQKAGDLAKHIAQLDPAEGHYAQAQIDQRRKEFKGAEVGSPTGRPDRGSGEVSGGSEPCS
jgi:tetratricopeptide (TPR) repeat protein